MSTNGNRFWLGVRAAIPVMIGFIPIGIAYAIMARGAGFSAFETTLMSVFVFAGASQMLAVGMYAQGASLIAIIFTTLIINMRHLIMGTCIVNRLRGEKVLPKLIASFGVTDESFAIFTTIPEEHCSMPYFFGLLTGTYSSWIVGSAIGAVASDFLPPLLTASLGISLYAMFIGLLVPNLRKNFKLGLLIALTAVCNSLLSVWIDSSWSLIISTLACAAVGVFFVDPEGKKSEGKKNEN